MAEAVEIEVAKFRQLEAEANERAEKVRLDRWKIITGADVLFAFCLSLAMVLVFALSCYGCHRSTDLDLKLAEHGLYSTRNGVQPIPKGQ